MHLKKIIRKKNSSVMTRKRLRSDTCLLCELEPKSMKDALDNEDWIQEISEQIEKNKTCFLYPNLNT